MSELLDKDGENNAVRAFLIIYGGQHGVTIQQMRDHMRMSGFNEHWPEWADNTEGHLTKAGAQFWIRYLFSLEPNALRAEYETKLAEAQARNEILLRYLHAIAAAEYERSSGWFIDVANTAIASAYKSPDEALEREKIRAKVEALEEETEDGLEFALKEAKEGIEILDNLIDSVQKHGNYTKDATLLFLSNARQCFNAIQHINEQ